MSIHKLQKYIEEFRKWINTHTPATTTNGQSDVFVTWGEELTSTQRLLEDKPELPIAFLGPSQQGKSSLINALLGENILAVGGAVGACTCVITSVHYRAIDGFKAEIDFIALDDWEKELKEIQQALDSFQATTDDTALDRMELEANYYAALEKFRAVYQTDPSADMEGLLTNPYLGLPLEIAQAMSTGTPITVEESTAKTFRDKVRRYLVGRDKHEDKHFWPLIGRVRLYGRFNALSNGVVLVDLPGLNDPNPAREQVTKKYLEEARYIWLICNSQTGIDRVFTQILRDNGFLFRLFMEGRLNAFSVIATKADDMNLDGILEQMGIDPDDYDGDYKAPLEFRRREIASHIQSHLLKIAQDIASKADSTEQREAFLERIRSIPSFAVSTAAYLHEKGKMPHYGGRKLSIEDTHVPRLIEHLHNITLEHSYKTQMETSSQRLRLLFDQVQRFFLDQIRRIEQDSEEARSEWAKLCKLAGIVSKQANENLQYIQIRSDESLKQRCSAFEQRLADLDEKAAKALQATFANWEKINWRSLQAAVNRRGEWFSRATNREYNFNRDIARAYLDLLPFVWDEFFGTHLSSLVEETANGTETSVKNMAMILIGAMEMLNHQPDGMRESMEKSLQTAHEGFHLQAAQVKSDLSAQIQRTRQSLSNGMVETASTSMQQAYSLASQVPAGSGIKQRLLTVLIQQAAQQAPALFINMRKELNDGVATLSSGMNPQLYHLVGNGERLVNQFQQNLSNHQVLTPEHKIQLQTALDDLPKLNF